MAGMAGTPKILTNSAKEFMVNVQTVFQIKPVLTKITEIDFLWLCSKVLVNPTTGMLLVGPNTTAVQGINVTHWVFAICAIFRKFCLKMLSHKVFAILHV